MDCYNSYRLRFNHEGGTACRRMLRVVLTEEELEKVNMFMGQFAMRERDKWKYRTITPGDNFLGLTQTAKLEMLLGAGHYEGNTLTRIQIAR